MGATRANTRGGGKDKNTAQKNSTQTTAKSTTVSETPTNKKMQATPDQLRMAQMLSADGGSDKTVEIQAQVRQIMDVTSKSEEAILTALHDCNYNTEQAILALIDSADDSNEWQTISSKKSKSQQNMQSVKQSSDSPTDIKDGRPDKKERGDRGDRDDFKEGKSQREGRSSRGRGRVPPRMARGRGRENGSSRDNDDQSFGGDRDRGFSNDRGSFGSDRRYNDRNESGRGRGRRFDHMNGGGGRRGRGGTRSFTNSKFGTFEGDAFTGAKPGDNVWTNPPKTNNRTNASNFTASTWDSVPPKSKQTVTPANDDWGIDDWTGDLSKSQVFTPSTTAQTTFKEESSPPVYTPSMDSAVVSSTISAPGNQPPMTQSIDLATLLGKPPGSMSSSTASVGESIQPPPRPQPDVFTPFAEMKPPVHTSKPHDQIGVQQVVVQQQRPAPVPNQVKTTRKKLPPPSKIPASAVEMPGSNRGLGALDVQFGVMDMNNDQSSGFSIGLTMPPSSSVPNAAPPSTLPVSGSMPPGITQKAGVFSVEHNSVSSSYAYPSQGTESSFSASSLSSTNASKVHMPFGGFEQTSMTEKNSQNKIPNPVAIPLPNQNDLKANTYLSPQKPQNPGAIDTYSTNQQSQISRSTTSTLSSSGLSSTSGLHQSATSYSTGAQSLGSRSGQSSYGNSEQSTGASGALTNSRSSVKTDSYTGSGAASTMTALGSNVMPSKGINPVSHNQGLSNNGPAGLNTSVPSSLTGTGSNAFGSSSLNSSSANSKITTSIGSASALGGLTNTSQSTSHAGLGSSSLNTGLSSTNDIATSSASTHTSVQTSPMSSSKIGLDTRLDSGSHGSRGTSSLTSQPSLASASLGVSPVTVSTSSLGYITTSASSLLSSTRTTQPSTTKTAPNIPPGMPILPNQYLMHNPLLVNAYAPQAYFNIDEMMMQSRMTMFPTQTAALAAGRDATTLGNTPYSVTEASKFGRTDASSPVATIATQQQTQQQGQTNHHQTQTAQQQPSFINPTVPPGYSYGGFPFYPAGLAGPVPGLQYTPAAMFPTMNANMIQATRSQSATTPHTGFQQHNTYGQHNSHTTFATGYDDLPGTQDFKTGYGGVSQTQSKNTVGRNSVVTSSSGPSDLTGSSYTNKSHAAFDSKSFHGTPPPFNIPLAGAGQGGHLNPPYAHSPFVPMMQQAHMLPHQMHSDGPGGTTQRSQTSATQGTKASYSNKGTYGWGS